MRSHFQSRFLASFTHFLFTKLGSNRWQIQCRVCLFWNFAIALKLTERKPLFWCHFCAWISIWGAVHSHIFRGRFRPVQAIFFLQNLVPIDDLFNVKYASFWNFTIALKLTERRPIFWCHFHAWISIWKAARYHVFRGQFRPVLAFSFYKAWFQLMTYSM